MLPVANHFSLLPEQDKGELPSVDHLLQASRGKVPEVEDEIDALMKDCQSFTKKKLDEITAYQSSAVNQAMSLEEKVRETNMFYVERIVSKASISVEVNGSEIIQNMKNTLVMDISGFRLDEFRFVHSLQPTGKLSNFIVDAIAYLWNKDWNDKWNKDCNDKKGADVEPLKIMLSQLAVVNSICFVIHFYIWNTYHYAFSCSIFTIFFFV